MTNFTTFEEVAAAINKMQYKPGDTMTISRLSIGGHITGTNGNHVFGFIPTAKPLVGVTAANFVNPGNTEMRIRHPNGGYCWDEAISVANESSECVTLTPTPDGLIFSFAWPDGLIGQYAQFNSNSPVSIELLHPQIAFS